MSTSEKQSRYRIGGMDCAGCAAKIEGAAHRIKGVENVNVSVSTRRMTITHADNAKLDKLVKRIHALGYGAHRLAANEASSSAAEPTCCDHDHDRCSHSPEHAPDSSLENDKETKVTRYQISGMDCASCAAKIDGAVRRVQGVEDVQVSVATSSMSVRHAPDTALGRLEKRVGALGYRSTRLAEDAPLPEADSANGCGHDHDHAHSHNIILSRGYIAYPWQSSR